MFNPQKDDYPANEAGQPEFASIILTVDPLSSNAPGDDVVQKMVLSTQDAIAALTNVAAYFGEPSLLAQPQNARLLAESGRAANPVFIYTTPRQGTLQIILGTLGWNMLVQHPDFGNSSALLASEKLQEVAAEAQAQVAQFAGGFAPLLMLDLTPEDLEQSASSDGQGSDIAEGLVEGADIVRVGDEA